MLEMSYLLKRLNVNALSLVVTVSEPENRNLLFENLSCKLGYMSGGKYSSQGKSRPKILVRKDNSMYSYICNSFASECPVLSWHCLIYIQLHMKRPLQLCQNKATHYSSLRTQTTCHSVLIATPCLSKSNKTLSQTAPIDQLLLTMQIPSVCSQA